MSAKFNDDNKPTKKVVMRPEDYFRERASRANIPKAKRILMRGGRGNPVGPGDER